MNNLEKEKKALINLKRLI